MLSSDFPTTPRPLPPAKVRRSASQQLRLPRSPLLSDSRSPPPYAPPNAEMASNTSSLLPLPTLLGSPIDATSRFMRFREPIEDIEASPEAQEWLQERSREELEGLLLRAGTLIKEREQELDLTSEACKKLSENNSTLKLKNDTLLSRLPTSRPHSPSSFSPIQAFSPSHSRSSSFMSTTWSPKIPPPKQRGHARKPSSTPAELAILADQNAELLNKLQDLETDAARTDQAGKRRLKGLEREIQGLKEELDKTRAMSERLEEAIQAAPSMVGTPEGLDEELLKMWKKLSREAKVRELKAKTRPWEEVQANEGPRDFAPGSSCFSMTSPFTPGKRVAAMPTPLLSTDSSHVALETPERPIVNGNLPTLPLPFSSSPNKREHAIVSQLLLKIRELEETNNYLAAQHLEARIKLRQAEHETESVKRLCEFISDEVGADGGLELEMVLDSADEMFDAFNTNTNTAGDRSPKKFRLKSVGRRTSMNFDSLRRGDDSFGSGLRKFNSMESLASSTSKRRETWSVSGQPEYNDETATFGHTRVRPRLNTPKMRKSVRGLFEEDSSFFGAPGSTSDISEGASFKTADLYMNDSAEPSLSNTGDSPSASALDEGCQIPSLGSELGEKVGEGLGLRPSMSHLRSESIADLLNRAESEPEPTAPSVGSNLTLHNSSNMHSASGKEKVGTSRDRTNGPPTLDEEIMFPKIRRAKSSFTVRSRSSDGAKRSSASPKPTKSNYGYSTLLLELWLWLQFAVVIVVFIFTMARQGPKSFLRQPATPSKKAN